MINEATNIVGFGEKCYEVIIHSKYLNFLYSIQYTMNIDISLLAGVIGVVEIH